jgi:hypothetical protein
VEAEAMKVQPLREVFESLSDPLAERRYRQPLGRTLTLVFMALASGEPSERGIAAWLQEQGWRLKEAFGYRRGDVPSYSPIQRALQTVDSAELEAKLENWASQWGASEPEWAGVAIDGKVLRGSETERRGALDVLNAFSHQLGVVLGQRQLGDKTNEIPEIIPLLEALTLTGRLVTVDALHTQRQTAQTIVEKGGPI